MFGISALQALDSAMNSDLRQLADSGIGPLRDALTRFLTAEQGRVALANITAAAAGLVARQQRDLQAGRLAGGDRSDHASAVTSFESRVSELQDHLTAVADRIASTADGVVPGVISERGPGWEAELSGILAPAATTPPGAGAAPDADPVSDALDALRVAGRQAAGDWLERRAAELREAVIGTAAEDIGALLDLARSPRELGAAIAGLPVYAGGLAGWAAEEVPEFAVPVVDWIVPDPPARSRRRRSSGSADDDADRDMSAAADAAVAGFAGRAESAFRVAAADWARRLGEQAGRQASAETAQFRRYLSVPPREDDVTVLTDLAGRLTGFRESLAAWVPDGISVAAGTEAEPQAAAVARNGLACRICGELEMAQTQYLMRRQYLLATSEADQARHADTGGFCPLHTWQYAHLASPVGISAGNARLASQVAGALRDAAADCRNASELAGRVAVLARTSACPACAVLARTEGEAAQELAAQAPPADEPPPLCLRHLALVLQKHPSLPAGRALTSALAATLQRSSENMRAYALKREALRRGLITADEASANSDALRLLAGQPALALPTQPE